MGFASLVADAMSMGLGDTLSEMAERDFIRREWERETWEMDTNPSGKVQEMQELYVQKGVSEEDASRILEIFSKYKVFFVEHMMQVELGLLAPDEPPWAKGAVTFVSFCLFGAVPRLTPPLRARRRRPVRHVRAFHGRGHLPPRGRQGYYQGPRRAEQCRRLWSAHDRERRSGGRRVVSYRPGV